MSASINPDIVTDGLVLCLDAANSDCFRGEPTTNIATNIFNFASNYVSANMTRANNAGLNFTGENNAGLLTITNNVPGSMFIYKSFTGVNTKRYTVSWFVKAGTLDRVSLTWVFGAPHNGNATNFDFNLSTGVVSNVTNGFFSGSGPAAGEIYPLGKNLGNGWWQISYSTTMTGINGYTQMQIFPGAVGGTVHIGGVQVEEKPYPTEFVNGTRGGTVATGGGLVDLSGNNNNNAAITRAAIPSSSFYSEENKGLWIFDGSTDRINLIAAPNRLADSCTEVWFKSNGSQGTQRSMIFGYEHEGSNFSETVTGPITLLSNNKIKATVITSTEVYRSVTSNTTINNNQFYHVCLNKDTVNGILSLYINGIFEISNTFDSDNLSYWAGLYRGRNYVEIGGYYNSGSTTAGVGGNLNGSIGICKMYNRILEPYEIYKNYKALKGRYGL